MKQIKLNKAASAEALKQLNEGITPLENTCSFVRGVTYQKSQVASQPHQDKIPILRANNIGKGLNFEDLVYVDKSCISPQQILKKNDVVIAMSSGSKSLVGKTAVFDHDWQGSFGAFCGVLRPNHLVDGKYFGFFFQSQSYRQTATALSSGTNINNLKPSTLKKLDFPFIKLEKQKVVAAKLDQLLPRVHGAQEKIKKTRDILKRFRKAVLHNACTGKLTEDWRSKQESTKPSHDFLGKIMEDRERLWHETQSSKGRKRKCPAPVPHNEESLPPIPEEWLWTSADTLCSQITDGEHIQPRYQKEGFPMLTAKHVRDGFVIFDEAGLIAEKDFVKCLERCAPKKDDILIVSVGATTGRTAIVENSQPFALVRSVLLLRPIINPQYFLFWCQSPWCFQWMQGASGASAQPHFYIKDARRMPVPLPPLSEQQEIIRQAKSLLALADKVEKSMLTLGKDCDRTVSSVLAAAFRGEL